MQDIDFAMLNADGGPAPRDDEEQYTDDRGRTWRVIDNCVIETTAPRGQRLWARCSDYAGAMAYLRRMRGDDE